MSDTATGEAMTGTGARKLAVVTGASSGIGAATARRLVAEGFDVVVGARRLDRLREVAEPIGARAIALDVCDTGSVGQAVAVSGDDRHRQGRGAASDRFCTDIPACHLLVNNAGGAKGLAPVAGADEEAWRWMYDANVLGVMRMTRALLPKLVASDDGHIVVIGSIAGFEPYAGGAGYNAAKFGVRAVTACCATSCSASRCG